ncbi:uncharacterized protein LOC128300783 [Anopheles moucheti]|uniref:uncharacterized protein LOC128300783 n=1 Tax=Anopheles moucheti TaxID=186751 RepID=UPI0022F05F09|nr:uncharacterized protein LOC128300783 [Anopheles moucheti]
MREPIATAPALTAGNVVVPSTAATMFGITNAQIVQSFNGLPPLQGDCPPAAGQPCIVRTVSRASSIGGAGTLRSLKSIGGSGASSPVTSVKRNSSSSSFSSSSERRSVFYTDPEQSSTTEAAEKDDVMTNDDSCSTSDACNATMGTVSGGAEVRRQRGVLKDQRSEPKDDGTLRRLDNGQVRRKQRPCSVPVLEGVIGPKTHLKLVSQELEWERKFRDDQLSRILKALIAFETRLKNEQCRIKQQLYEKDDVINRQNCTINRMKRKLAADEGIGGSDGEEANVDEVAQYCPKCRKNYYRLECRTNGTQTFDYCRDDGAESVNTENLSLNSVEYASSSEEQESSLYVRANSFKDARRSRKYTSKRSYQGYQRGPSRASSFKSNASPPVTGALAKLVERNGRTGGVRRLSGPREEESGHEAYVNIEPNANVPKIVIYENYESDKENARMDQNRQECNNYDNVEPYSNRIDTMHGIHGQNGGRFVDDGQRHPHKPHQEQKQERTDGHGDYRSVGSMRGDGSEQMELDDGTIFYEANASAGSVSNQQKYTEGMEMKQTIETNDDWYASASDMEDSDTALGKPYSNAAVNPVLECVNQILLQQSMDGFGDSNKDTTGEGADEEEHYIKAQQPAPPPVKEPTAVRSKRVHFSTQNSMVQVPRISLQPTTSVSIQGSGSINRKDDKVSPTYEIQSIYSNEYEPIGSEHNSYSNYYVDMESKLGSEDREREQALAEKRKTPPALPPKPANLLKLQQLSKGNQQQRQLVSSPAKGRSSSAQSDIAESEPDYCSISEIQDSVKCVQIVAEIHKDACEDDYSIVDEEEKEKQQQQQQEGLTRTEADDTSSKKSCNELEESFADVPKLPNVAEIVPPKKEPLNKFIAQDNYITKSSGSSSSKASHSSGAGVAASVSTPSKKDGEFREQLSEIIAEINKQSPAIRNASKKQIPVKDLSPAFRAVSQIPSVAFQSKLKPVDKLSFLSKTSAAGMSGSIPSLIHTTPKLSSSIARPSIKPSMLKSSLSTKALSSTNLTLGNGVHQFGSPVKSVSYIPNLKSPNVSSPLVGGVAASNGTASAGCSPLKSSSTSVKKVASAINLAMNGSAPISQTSVASVPIIIAEDSKLPIQAEFDWYNLDAEYGKSNQPDVIVEADPSSNGEAEGTGDEEDSVSCAESPSKKKGLKVETTNGVPAAEERSSTSATTTDNGGSECEEELENVEYNLDEEYKSLGPIVPPPDIIQKSVHPPITPPKNGKIPYNSLSFKELMQLNETPKAAQETKAKPAKTAQGTENVPSGRNYEHFLDDSGLCSKPIILPRKKRVYYSGPFV